MLWFCPDPSNGLRENEDAFFAAGSRAEGRGGVEMRFAKCVCVLAVQNASAALAKNSRAGLW
jgi:hypothetical protein